MMCTSGGHSDVERAGASSKSRTTSNNSWTQTFIKLHGIHVTAFIELRLSLDLERGGVLLEMALTALGIR